MAYKSAVAGGLFTWVISSEMTPEHVGIITEENTTEGSHSAHPGKESKIRGGGESSAVKLAKYYAGLVANYAPGKEISK